MKYLVLACGNQKEWNALTKAEQNELLSQDEVLRKRGDTVAAVQPDAIVLRAWEGKPTTANGPIRRFQGVTCGFGIIEAADINEVIRSVSNAPCARANGAVEIRAIAAIN